MPRRSTGCESCRQRKIRVGTFRSAHWQAADLCSATSESHDVKDVKILVGRINSHLRHLLTLYLFLQAVECPGYRPPADRDFRFVDQTRHTFRNAGSEDWEAQQLLRLSRGTYTKHYQWVNLLYEPAKLRRPVNISKRHVHRIQLLSTFLDLYLPKTTDNSTSHFEYIANLPNVDLSSPLLQVSIDTLCLVELGSLYQDERCLRESSSRYVRALPMLARELTKPPSKRMSEDDILTTITVLALCELFGAIANNNDGNRGWISHVSGAEKYVQANGPQSISSPFGRLLFHNVRHSSMCKGFVERKAVCFADPKWLKVTADLAKQDPYVALYDLAVQIPGLLERADAVPVLAASPLLSDVLRQDICYIRTELDQWLKLWYTDHPEMLYRIVDVRDMKDFSRLCLDRTFQTVFDFDSVQKCLQLQLYWTCCVLLDFTLLAIRSPSFLADPIQISAISRAIERTDEDVSRDLFLAATSYCRSIPFCCKSDTASVGRAGSFFLHITEAYLEHYGHCNEKEWCKAVLRILDKPIPNSKDREEAPHNIAPIGPWNVEHRCKSPICSFRVECVAPAPILLSGEHPNQGVISGHPSSELGFVHAAD